MRDRIGLGFARPGRVVFAVCMVCTVWLVVQNSMMLALLPGDRLPAAMRGMAPVVHLAGVLGIAMMCGGGAFGLGWGIARVVRGAQRSAESAHAEPRRRLS